MEDFPRNDKFHSNWSLARTDEALSTLKRFLGQVDSSDHSTSDTFALRVTQPAVAYITCMAYSAFSDSRPEETRCIRQLGM